VELVKEELEELQRRYGHHRQGLERKSTSEEASLTPVQMNKINGKSSTMTLSPPAPALKVPGKPFTAAAAAASGAEKSKSTQTPAGGAPDKEEIWGDYDEMLQKIEQLDRQREASVEKGIRQLAHDLFSRATNENPQLAMQRLAIFVDKLAKL